MQERSKEVREHTSGVHRAVRRLIQRHFEGRIDAADEKRMRAHLAECAECRECYERHLLLASMDPDALSAQERLGRGLGLGAAVSTASPWRIPMVVVAAAAAVVLAWVGVRTLSTDGPPGARRSPHGFQARGKAKAAKPELRIYRMKGARAVRVERQIEAKAELAFAVVPPPGHRYLMVFGVDHKGHVFWYHPAWTDAKHDPKAIEIDGKKALVELREAIRHDLSGPSLRVHAVFLKQPMSVRELEKELTSGQPGGTKERLGLDQSVEIVHTLKVVSGEHSSAP